MIEMMDKDRCYDVVGELEWHKQVQRTLLYVSVGGELVLCTQLIRNTIINTLADLSHHPTSGRPFRTDSSICDNRQEVI